MGRIEEIEARTRDWEGSFFHGEVMLLQLTHVNWLIAEVERLRSLAVALEQEVARLDHANTLLGEERDAHKRAAGDLKASLGHMIAARDQAVQSRDHMANELRQWRGCPSCMEDHPEGTSCPPHEVRTTGQAWRERQTRHMAARAEQAEDERDARKAEVGDLQASLGHVQALRDQAVEIRDEMAEERDALKARVSEAEHTDKWAAINRALEIHLFGHHLLEPSPPRSFWFVQLPDGTWRAERDYAGTGDGMLRVIVALEAKGYHCGMDWRDGWRYVWVRNSSGAVSAVAPTWPAAFALAALRAVAPDVAEQLERGEAAE